MSEDRLPEELRRLISTRLDARDKQDILPYVFLARQNWELRLKEQIASRQIAQLTSGLQASRTGSSSPMSVNALGADPEELKQKNIEIQRLQEDLNKMYKAKDEITEEQKKSLQKIAEMTDELAKKDRALTDAQINTRDMETAMLQKQEAIKEGEQSVLLLRSELKGLSLRLACVEEELEKAKADRESLTTRLLKKSEKEAEVISELQREKEAAVLSAQQAILAASARGGPAQGAYNAGSSTAQPSHSTQQSPEQQSSDQDKQASQRGTSAFSWLFPSRKEEEKKEEDVPVRREEVMSSLVNLPSSVQQRLNGHTGDINAVCYSTSGAQLLSCSSDKTIKLWDTATWNPVAEFTGCGQGVMWACMSVNDDLVLGCSHDKSARIWTVAGARLKETLTGHQNKVTCGCFVGATGRVATGSQDRTIRLWDVQKGLAIKTIICYSACNDLCTVPATQLLMSAHMDKSIRLWDATRGESYSTIEGAHAGQVTCCAASPDNRLLLSCGRDNVVNLYDSTTRGKVGTLSHPEYICGLNTTRVCFSPDGKYVAAGSANGNVFFWEVGTRKHVHTIHPKDSVGGPAICVSWHPTGANIAVASKEAIEIWK